MSRFKGFIDSDHEGTGPLTKRLFFEIDDDSLDDFTNLVVTDQDGKIYDYLKLNKADKDAIYYICRDRFLDLLQEEKSNYRRFMEDACDEWEKI